MSEVNQAFLRAYLKNRASQTREGVPTQAAVNEGPAGSPPLRTHQASFSSSSQPPHPTQIPVATTIRQSTPGPRPSVRGAPESSISGTRIEQPVRSVLLGEHMRIDPSHGPMRSQPAPSAPEAPAASAAIYAPAPQSTITAVPQPQSGRGGVWSPLGVERGMKAMESSKASPAIVRNGVEAVSRESAIQRRSQVQQPHASNAASHLEKNRDLEQNHVAVPSSQYNPIQYVDGLRGHVGAVESSSNRTSDRTLSEITKPIAFGTGLGTKEISDNATQTIEPKTRETQHREIQTDRSRPSDVLREAMPPRERGDSGRIRSDESPTYRRIDNAHIVTPDLPVAFAPSWEVDCFLWPEVVKQIERSHADAFRQIGKHLCTANRDGLKVMAITSGERGVGRSTVAMHMARSAAASGLKVALVEGDAFCPSLIDQLRLDIEHGWADCLFENVPLHEAAIHSIQDGITLFPLKSVISAQELHANLHRIAKLIKRISTAFDIVFIDANRLNLEQRDLVGVSQESVIDAAIVVVDTELSIKEKVDSAVGILQNMGLSSIGLVENFQS